jgi:predicted extracellular nuclease
LHDVLAKAVPAGERYTYNYRGTTEQIDHLLVTDGLSQAIEGAGVHHFGADMPEALAWGTTPYRTTDHDVPYATFRLPAPAAADAKKS